MSVKNEKTETNAQLFWPHWKDCPYRFSVRLTWAAMMDSSRRKKPIYCAWIEETTGLSQPTIRRAIKALADDGFCKVQKSEPFKIRRGAEKLETGELDVSIAHVARGLPTATQEQIDARLAICRSCPLFDGSICRHADCGCRIGQRKKFLNKLAWADQSCPLEKWTAISPID